MFLKKHKYLNMVREIALTDLKLKYQGSILGYIWSLLKPLLLFSVMYVVFTKVFKLGNAIPHYPVYLLLGIVIWTFFAEVTGVCMGSIVSKGALIRKVFFPRILLVFANSTTSLITFLLNFVAVAIFMFFNKISPSIEALYLPLLFLELYIFVLGLSLLLSALYVKFRDIAHIWEVLLQALFYGTPILYPLSLVPAPYAKFLALSPIAQIIQDARFVLVTHETTRVSQVLTFPYVLIPYIAPVVLLVIGYLVFNKMSLKFAEEV